MHTDVDSTKQVHKKNHKLLTSMLYLVYHLWHIILHVLYCMSHSKEAWKTGKTQVKT